MTTAPEAARINEIVVVGMAKPHRFFKIKA